MKVYLHHNSYSIRQVYWNYKTKQDTRTWAQMSILTMSRTFAFAPASNKHLIASVKPFSAAFNKGLSPGLALLTLAPPYQMQVWQANHMVVLSLIQRWINRNQFVEILHSYCSITENIIPESIASHRTQKICVMPCLGLQTDDYLCWAGKKQINNLIFMPKYDSSKKKM
jgi:hypothetical protein